jgi:hypothetical protein
MLRDPLHQGFLTNLEIPSTAKFDKQYLFPRLYGIVKITCVEVTINSLHSKLLLGI